MATRQLWDKLQSGELSINGIKLGGVDSGSELKTYTQILNMIDEGAGSAGYMVWKGEWVDGSYIKNQVVRDNNWLMIANKATSDKPAPTALGNPFYLYEGTNMTNQTAVGAKQVVYGTRYTSLQPFWLDGVRINVKSGQTYDLFAVIDPLGEPILRYVGAFKANADGWRDFGLVKTLYGEGLTFDILVITSIPEGGTTSTSANYSYQTPNNPSSPSSGRIIHAKNAVDTLQINYTDNDGIDRSTLIQSLTAGDRISASGMIWTVQSNADESTYADITITPPLQTSPVGTHSFTFVIASAHDLEYGKQANYYSGVANVSGLLAIDGSYADVIADDSAYGTDILVQNANISEDWDVLSVTSTEGGTVGDGGGTSIVSSYDYIKVQPGLDISPGVSAWTRLATLGPVIGRAEGLYEYKIMWGWKLSSTTASVQFRYSLDEGGSWEYMSYETKDTTDTHWMTYFFPISRDDGQKQLWFECYKDNAGNELDVPYCDLVIQRVA